MSRLPKPTVLSLFFVILLGGVTNASGATCTSNAGARNWNTVASWNCGHVPAAADSVIIPNSSTVTLDVNTNTLASLQVDAGGILAVAAGTGFDVFLGGNLVNNGTINFFTSTSTNAIYLAGNNITSTFSGTGTWQLDRIDLNGSGGSSCRGTCKVELSGSPNLQFFNATPFSALGASFTFNALGNSTATVTLALLGNQTIATANAIYPNLVLAGSNTKTPSAGTLNILGDLTVSAGMTYAGNTSNPAINLAGNFSNSGTFTAGTGTVTLTGTNSTLGGSVATTVNNLIVNKTAGNNVSIVCATPSPTVNATLTLTSGDIVTSGSSPGCATTCATQVPIIVAAAGTVAGGSANSYVQGALRKMFNAAGTLNFRAAGLDEFPVGDATNYTPVEITAGTTSTAGSVTACVTSTDHPQVTTPVATTGIDAAKSVNRYWSLITATINTTAAPVNAIFKFNGAFVYAGGDVDNIATTGNFIVEKYGTYWSPTTLVAAGGSSTQASNIDLTATNNDIAIGEPLLGFTALPGQFNAFETTTPAGAVLGMIQTKQAGVAFSVRAVHLLVAKNAIDNAYAQAGVTVELLDSSDNTGVLNATTACRPIGAAVGQWHPIAGTTQTVTFAAGVATANITAAMLPNVYRDVRVHIKYAGAPVANQGEGCSTDRFALRPQSLTVTAWDATWTTAGTSRQLNNIAASGGIVHKAATAFTLRATPVPASATLYDGSPTTVATFPTCGGLCTTVGGLSFTAASWAAAGSGVRENATSNYSEAGTFNLQLEDASYASVDAVDGTPAATLTVPVTASVEIGRFVPDHFDAIYNTPTFMSAIINVSAPDSFTYIGQPFVLNTAAKPIITITAKNAANVATANYTGTLWKITGSFITSQTWADASTTPCATCLPLVVNGGVALVATTVADTGGGSGTVTFALANGLNYTRPATPVVPFNSALTLSGNLGVDADGVAVYVAGGPVTTYQFASVGFTDNNVATANDAQMRYGRTKINSANGSELLQLPVVVTAQYWNASSNYVTSATDSVNSFMVATPLATSAVSFGNYQKNLVTISIVGSPKTVTLSSGAGGFILSAPGTGINGSVDMSIPILTGASCAVVPIPLGCYLPSNTGRATFGVYQGRKEFVYMRENY